MDQNSRFLLRAFRKYYRVHTPALPDRFARREFGFMFFDRSFVQRHMGFTNAGDLHRFMESQVPSHCYYSTAYYRKPAAPTMEEKEWMGAELIFDLDADHLEGAENMTFDDMLAQIKREMMVLVDSFLLGDLGFSEDDVNIVFSGGRGYHAHIKVPDVLGLGTHERREIVDYVTAKSLDIDTVFPLRNEATRSAVVNGRAVNNARANRMIPPADSGGWRLRMRNGLKEVVDDVCDLGPAEIRKRYPSVGSRKLDGIQADLRKSRKLIFENNKMSTLRKNTQDLLVEIMAKDMAVRLSGEVDEPVTADIKRLIRLPGSIHGKSGMRVMPLTRSQLTDFDPLSMAVPEEYSEEEVTVSVKRPYELNIRDQHFKLDAGVQKVPEYAAVFLVGRKVADIGDGTVKDPFF